MAVLFNSKNYGFPVISFYFINKYFSFFLQNLFTFVIMVVNMYLYSSLHMYRIHHHVYLLTPRLVCQVLDDACLVVEKNGDGEF